MSKVRIVEQMCDNCGPLNMFAREKGTPLLPLPAVVEIEWLRKFPPSCRHCAGQVRIATEPIEERDV